MKSNKITDEQFIEICGNSKSMSEACKKLGLAFSTFKNRAIKLNCYVTNQGGIGLHKKRKDGIPLKEILEGKHPDYQTYKLKIRLIKEGIKQDKCECCGWDKKPEGAQFTPCELHHINGNHSDHRLENLMIICPNCHSLTKNYRFRKRVPEEKSSEQKLANSAKILLGQRPN